MAKKVTIEEKLTGKRVKISAHSITILDENGKTSGLVRGVEKWYNWSFSAQAEHHAQLGKLKDIPAENRVAINGLIHEWTISIEGNIYYLHDLGRIKQAENFINQGLWVDEEKKKIENDRLAVEKMKAVNISVIDCYATHHHLQSEAVADPTPEKQENSEPTAKTGKLKPTKKRINALQKIVKNNKHNNQVAIQTEKAQFFGNGFMFVMLVASCFITPISEFFSNVADGFHHMARTFMNTVKAAEAETGEKLQLPTLQELKEIKRVCKLNDGKSIVDFGEKMPCIKADFLQKALESLSGKVEAWKRGKYNIYLKDEYGNVSYIMGIQLKPEVKREFWKNTLERNRELEEELRKQESENFIKQVIADVERIAEAEETAEKQENSVEESTPTTEKPTSTEEQPENPKGESIMNNTEIPTIKNLSQLKKALKANSGMMFEILDHNKPERIGEIRKVTSVNSVSFTSRVIDESGEMTGKDIYVEFEKACYWKFESEKISYLFTTGDVIMSFRFITENSIMNDNSITSKYNTEEQPATENPIEEPKTAWTGKADYAERRAEKAERYAERAEKAREKADKLQKPINDMHGDVAFFTQPNINTSAGRAFTNQRNRMFASYEKGFEERSKAEYYDTKAENLSKESVAISSDDPEALKKLKDKLEKLTAEHKEHLAHNKALNKAIKNGTAETNKFGWATLNGKSYYFTTNEAAEIRRLKDRIEELENLEVPENYSFDGGTVVFNTAENRVQILFDEIPDSETRENLKRNGFKWSPRQKAWQRMLNTTGIRTVKRLYPMPEKPTEENSVEETPQPTTENIVYPFILIDTPTAQPETAEEKTVEKQPTEKPTAAQPVITFDETLLNKARQMYYKVYVDSISNDGINYIGSETEISGVRIRIIPSDSWDDSITFYSVEKFAEYMNEELKLESEFWSDEVAQSVEKSAMESHMTREEILQAIEEETKASISPQQILFYGEKLLKSFVWVDGIRNKIAEIAFWKYGNGADKDFEILTIEVDRIQQNILDSLFKKETTAEESPVEEQPVENPAVTQPITTEQKFNETLAEKEKQCDLLNEMYQKHYDVDRPDEYYAAWGKLAEINKQLSELEARAYEEMKQSSVAEETITVEDTEIAVEKIPEVILEYKGNSEKLAILKDKALSLGATVSSTENHLTIDTYENHRPEIESVATELGLKTGEKMHETFSTVQGKINEVGTIEQKNIIYKIPWGIYRRYSAEDITNIVLTRTNDILAIKTENRLKAISALIDSVAPMTANKTMKLISNSMEKSGATAEQIAQAEIAIQYIGNPDKLNDYVFSKTYSTEENSTDNSAVNGNNTTAERKIRPPPLLKDFLKIQKEKR